MILSTEDKDLFYRLNWSLLFYVNKKYPVINGINTPDFKNQDLNKVLEIHNKIFANTELIDSFVAENPFNFNQDELDIIKSWKNFVKGRFYLVTHLKNHSIFLKDDEQKAFGVIGLIDEIEDIAPPYDPSLVETVLLPFKGKIIHYGLFQFHNILFGSGIKKNIKANYQATKSKFGIILSLDTPSIETERSDEELLRFYSKSEANRAQFWDEIRQLLRKNPLFYKIYYQEIGKSNSRRVKKRLSEIGLASRWFAIFEDIILASGQMEQEVKAQVDSLLPEAKRDCVYIFRHVYPAYH
jgi:L-rhamnose mutarotase